MQKIIFGITLILLLTICFAQDFSGGDGTETNPYQITNCNQLNAMNRQVGTKHYIIMNDFSCKDIKLKSIEEKDPDNPVYTRPFSGTFNGNDKTISDINMFIDYGYNGLFYKINNAIVKDVILENFSGGAAGLASECINNSIISNITFQGNIKGDVWTGTGGLLGSSSNCSIINSNVINTIIESNHSSAITGGLIGSSSDSSIINSKVINTQINGRGEIIGGLIGSGSRITIRNSKAINSNIEYNATNSTKSVGGLIGRLTFSEILNSYSDTTINALNASSIGGLFGIFSDSNACTIEYNTIDSNNGGKENALKSNYTPSNIGGFAGKIERGIINNAIIEIRDFDFNSRVATGGFAGKIDESTINSATIQINGDLNLSSFDSGYYYTGGFAGDVSLSNLNNIILNGTNQTKTNNINFIGKNDYQAVGGFFGRISQSNFSNGYFSNINIYSEKTRTGGFAGTIFSSTVYNVNLGVCNQNEIAPFCEKKIILNINNNINRNYAGGFAGDSCYSNSNFYNSTAIVELNCNSNITSVCGAGFGRIGYRAYIQDTNVFGIINSNNPSSVIGGFVGEIIQDSANVTVYDEAGAIKNSHFIGDINGGKYVGGFVGTIGSSNTTGAFDGLIINSSSKGNIIVDGNDLRIGGFIGSTFNSGNPYLSSNFSEMNMTINCGKDCYIGGFGGYWVSRPNINNNQYSKSNILINNFCENCNLGGFYGHYYSGVYDSGLLMDSYSQTTLNYSPQITDLNYIINVGGLFSSTFLMDINYYYFKTNVSILTFNNNSNLTLIPNNNTTTKKGIKLGNFSRNNLKCLGQEEPPYFSGKGFYYNYGLQHNFTWWTTQCNTGLPNYTIINDNNWSNFLDWNREIWDFSNSIGISNPPKLFKKSFSEYFNACPIIGCPTCKTCLSDYSYCSTGRDCCNGICINNECAGYAFNVRYCGDGICDETETPENCPEDCQTECKQNEENCTNHDECCSNFCDNGTCKNKEDDENFFCKNGIIDIGEQCGEPGLNCSNPNEICVNCKCHPIEKCGNYIIDEGEQCGEPDLKCENSNQFCINCKCYLNSEEKNDIISLTGNITDYINLEFNCRKHTNNATIRIVSNNKIDLLLNNIECNTNKTKLIIEKDLNTNQIYEIKLIIPPECSICTKTIFAIKKIVNQELIIPDNNPIILIILILLTLTIITKNKTKK